MCRKSIAQTLATAERRDSGTNRLSESMVRRRMATANVLPAQDISDVRTDRMSDTGRNIDEAQRDSMCGFYTFYFVK